MCVCVCDGIPEGCWFVLAAREREIYYAYAVRAKGEETFAYIYIQIRTVDIAPVCFRERRKGTTIRDRANVCVCVCALIKSERASAVSDMARGSFMLCAPLILSFLFDRARTASWTKRSFARAQTHSHEPKERILYSCVCVCVCYRTHTHTEPSDSPRAVLFPRIGLRGASSFEEDDLARRRRPS